MPASEALARRCGPLPQRQPVKPGNLVSTVSRYVMGVVPEARQVCTDRLDESQTFSQLSRRAPAGVRLHRRPGAMEQWKRRQLALPLLVPAELLPAVHQRWITLGLWPPGNLVSTPSHRLRGSVRTAMRWLSTIYIGKNARRPRCRPHTTDRPAQAIQCRSRLGWDSSQATRVAGRALVQPAPSSWRAGFAVQKRSGPRHRVRRITLRCAYRPTGDWKPGFQTRYLPPTEARLWVRVCTHCC